MKTNQRTVLRTCPRCYVRLAAFSADHFHIGCGNQAFPAGAVCHLDPPRSIIFLQYLDCLAFTYTQLVRRCRRILEHYTSPHDL